MKNILLVEDDYDLNQSICFSLKKSGYGVFSVALMEEGKRIFAKEQINMILLDVNLPDGEGFSFARWVQGQKEIPIIYLTARDMEEDVLEGYESGAEDYVTKPFGSEELVARVRSALRTVLYQAHDSELPTGKFQTGDLLIDYEARRVFIGDEEIKLTQTEYNIVDLLSRHPGKMLTYSFIVKEVWGYNDMGSTKRLQVNMANIRKKFGVKPGKKSFIINELGVGYRMCDDSEKLIDSI